MCFFSGKTILVTGATGLIGSHLIEKLMTMNDVKIIALSRSIQKLKDGFAEYLSNPNFAILAQDISEPLNMNHRKIDYIFHAAGPMEGKIILNTPMDVILPNLTGTKNCLELLRTQFKTYGTMGRMVLFSSITVYGNITGQDSIVSESDTMITEKLESEYAPYSQAKRMSEVIAQAYRRQYNIDVVIGRISTIYGYTKYCPDTAFYEFIKKASSGENIILNHSGMARRDNLYIDDAISGLLTICEKGINGEAYNISSNAELGNYLAIDEIAKTIVEIVNEKYDQKNYYKTKVDFKSTEIKKRNGGIILDNTKLKLLGWNLETSFREGVIKTIDRFQEKNSKNYK